MKNFKHPHVLPLLGVVIQENVPYVILPFMDNGDLKTFVSNENNVRQKQTFVIKHNALMLLMKIQLSVLSSPFQEVYGCA